MSSCIGSAVFCDASLKAYAAVTYLRVETASGAIRWVSEQNPREVLEAILAEGNGLTHEWFTNEWHRKQSQLPYSPTSHLHADTSLTQTS